MSNIFGRQVVLPLTNKSGGSVAAGDVVVIDTDNDASFETTTTGGETRGIGIAQETIANNAVGRVLVSGYAALVNVAASVTRGHYGKTHTVAKQATSQSSRGTGTFCQFITGGATPEAMLFGLADLSTSSSGVPAGTANPGGPTDGDLFYRTDLDLFIRYRSTGTRWVCTCLHRTDGLLTAVLPFSATNSIYMSMHGLDLDIWIEKWFIWTTVLTTNNGTNFWTCTLKDVQATTTYATFSTGTTPDTAGTKTNHEQTIGALLGTTSPDDLGLQVDVTKTLSPGNIYPVSMVTYRLVVT
jgi:hypothetical protein